MSNPVESYLLSPSSEYDAGPSKPIEAAVLKKNTENFAGFIGIKWVAMIYVAIIQIVSCLVLSKRSRSFYQVLRDFYLVFVKAFSV